MTDCFEDGALCLPGVMFVAAAIAVSGWVRSALERRAAEVRRHAAEEERIRIARDLHDAVAQGLTGIMMHVESCRHLAAAVPDLVRSIDGISALARSTLLATERLLLNLRPLELGSSRLDEGVRQMLAAVLRDLAVEGIVTVRGEARKVVPKVEDQLFRIVQEAVTNALRHASPSRIEVELDYRDSSRLQLCVRADAHVPGVSVTSSGRHVVGSGVAGMRSRAEAIGARFNVVTAPNGGVEIHVSSRT